MARRPFVIDPDEIAEWTRKSREAQGLPPKITDPATLRKIATIMWPRGVEQAS